MNLQLTQVPIAQAGMLIRKPVAEVFEAFVDPVITSRFWFTKSTGQLEAGKRVTWTWEMYSHSVEVEVKAIEVNKRILIDQRSQLNRRARSLSTEDFAKALSEILGDLSREIVNTLLSLHTPGKLNATD